MNAWDSIERPETIAVRAAKEENKTKHVKSMRRHPGHSLFEYNNVDETIHLADFESIALLNGSIRKKVVMKPDCTYVFALNKKNAMKKLAKK